MLKKSNFPRRKLDFESFFAVDSDFYRNKIYCVSINDDRLKNNGGKFIDK